MQNGPLDLILTDCEIELFRRIWPARLQRAQKAVFSCKLATRFHSPSLRKRIISRYLASKTPKSPKSRVQVQNGPLDLIRPVCEKIILLYYMANPFLGKSLCSDWFFLGQDFAVRTVSMETVQSVYFCFGAKPANSKFATKTAKKRVNIVILHIETIRRS